MTVESGGYTKEGRSGRSKKVGETVIARSYGGIGKEWMDSASEEKAMRLKGRVVSRKKESLDENGRKEAR